VAVYDTVTLHIRTNEVSDVGFSRQETRQHFRQFCPLSLGPVYHWWPPGCG